MRKGQGVAPTWNLKNLRECLRSPLAAVYTAEQMRMWIPTSFSSYLITRSSVSRGAKRAMLSSGVDESLSVSRCSCVCTSTLSPTLARSAAEELASEM